MKKTLVQITQTTNEITDSTRIICTPSYFAKSTLFHIQEIGRLVSLQPHQNKRQYLNSYLLLLVEAGIGTIIYNNVKYNVSKGDMAFIDCKQPYIHESNHDSPWQLKWIHFNNCNMERFYMYFWTKFNTIIIKQHDITFFANSHNELMNLVNKPNIDVELKISSIIDNLITHLLTQENDSSSSRIYEKIELLKKYIELNFHKKITLSSLSKEFFISKYYLAREFKKMYGTTIIQYVIYCRVTKSKELLRYSNMHIEEIARQVGIEDNSYFNKVFQKLEGISPREYRNQWCGAQKVTKFELF